MGRVCGSRPGVKAQHFPREECHLGCILHRKSKAASHEVVKDKRTAEEALGCEVEECFLRMRCLVFRFLLVATFIANIAANKRSFHYGLQVHEHN